MKTLKVNYKFENNTDYAKGEDIIIIREPKAWEVGEFKEEVNRTLKSRGYKGIQDIKISWIKFEVNVIMD